MKATKTQEPKVFQPIKVELVFETQKEFDVFKGTLGNTGLSNYKMLSKKQEDKALFESLILKLFSCL